MYFTEEKHLMCESRMLSGGKEVGSAQTLWVWISLKFQEGRMKVAVHRVPGRCPNSLLDKSPENRSRGLNDRFSSSL